MQSLAKQICTKAIVFLVWLLIFAIALSFYALYLPELYSKNGIYFIFLSFIFTIDFILLVISYGRATCTQPGSPDDNLTEAYRKSNKLQEIKSLTSERQGKRKIRRRNQYRNGSLDEKQMIEEIKEMKLDEYCAKCCIVRQPRAHHCSVCKKCILRMDHHCPWTGNCIGLKNHKYFLLFLLYATLGLAIVSFNILIDWALGKKVVGDVRQEFKIYVFPIVGLASFMLMIAIGFLLIAQVLMIAANLTTLESFLEGIEDHNPFDRGSVRENFKEIFGASGISLLPTAPVLKQEPVVHEIYG